MEELANYILESAPSGYKYLVGINGKDGSGKTYLADQLAASLRSMTSREVIRISIDDFFQPRAIRKRNPDQARGCYEDTIDVASFRRYVLEPLSRGGSGEYRHQYFDYASDQLALGPLQQAGDNAITVVDGVFLYRDDMRRYWDTKILIEVDREKLIERGARRDVKRIGSYEEAKRRYVERYMPSQDIYYQEAHPRRYADIVVDNNNFKNQYITYLQN